MFILEHSHLSCGVWTCGGSETETESNWRWPHNLTQANPQETLIRRYFVLFSMVIYSNQVAWELLERLNAARCDESWHHLRFLSSCSSVQVMTSSIFFKTYIDSCPTGSQTSKPIQQVFFLLNIVEKTPQKKQYFLAHSSQSAFCSPFVRTYKNSLVKLTRHIKVISSTSGISFISDLITKCSKVNHKQWHWADYHSSSYSNL